MEDREIGHETSEQPQATQSIAAAALTDRTATSNDSKAESDDLLKTRTKSETTDEPFELSRSRAGIQREQQPEARSVLSMKETVELPKNLGLVIPTFNECETLLEPSRVYFRPQPTLTDFLKLDFSF